MSTSSRPVPSEAERAAAMTMLRMIWGIHISRVVHVVAKLGIADLLAAGPVSSAELAKATGTHQQSLYRVLRLLAALDVFEEVEPGTFGLTELGNRLRSDAPASMRSWATFLVGGVQPYEHILETVQTGTPGIDIAYGMGLFEYVSQDPDGAARFDAAMSERTAAVAPSVASAYDFSSFRSIVDVGGNQGTLLAEILRRNPHLHGIVFDTPAVLARAGTRPGINGAADLDGRYDRLAGDFFEQVPAGGDCYILSNILHDWDDERAITILRNCRQSMARAGKVLIVERLIPDKDGDPVPTLLSDINMLINTGGRERTNAEYGGLLAAADLRIGIVRQVAFPYGIIEGLS